MLFSYSCIRSVPVPVERERASRDFSDRVCTASSSLVRVHYTKHQDRLNAVPADTQMRASYPGGSCAGISKIGKLLHSGDNNGEQERAGRNPPSDAAGDEVEVIHPLENSS